MKVKLWISVQLLAETLARTASHTKKVGRRPISVEGNVWINPTLDGLDEKTDALAEQGSSFLKQSKDLRHQVTLASKTSVAQGQPEKPFGC